MKKLVLFANNRFNPKKLLLIFGLINVMAVKAQICVSSPTSYSVGSGPTSLLSADFNNDGNKDLAITDESSNDVAILLGSSSGTFGTATYINIGSGLSSITSADFNGDGNIDLAAPNFSNNVSVLLGNGSGGFGSPTNYTITSGNNAAITSTDFNGDHIIDLATAGVDVSILLGNGTGGFICSGHYATGTNPIAIINADFNGDGKKDLATANQTSSISVLLGDGAGGFGTATNFGIGTQPSGIVCSDFNNDTKLDLAASNIGSNNISLLLGTGTGSFGSATNFSTGAAPFSITNGDFNNDGNMDVATANATSNNVSVLLGTGTGSFNSSLSYLANNYAYSITSEDLNGDNKKDLVVTNFYANTTSVLLNETFVVAINSSNNNICPGNNTTLTASGANNYIWSSNAGNAITNTVTVSLSSNTTYTAMGVIGTCSLSNTINVSVVAPEIPSICLVSTDSASNYQYNVIYWDKTGYNNVDSFIVYRYDAISNNYLHLGSVSKNSLSDFTDTAFNIGGPNGGNPQYASWKYKLAIRDTCGNIGTLSPYHQSIFMQQNTSNFSWTPYIDSGQANVLTGYSFLRDDNNTGNWHVLVNLGNTSTSTTDPNYNNYQNGNWRVDAIGFNCTPTQRTMNVVKIKSHSNLKISAGQSTGIKYSTEHAINICPNPATDYIYLDNIQGPADIEIVNLQGQIVKSIKNCSEKIDVSDLNNGMYFLHVSGQAKNKILKFVK